jgi:hypothetical protein
MKRTRTYIGAFLLIALLVSGCGLLDSKDSGRHVELVAIGDVLERLALDESRLVTYKRDSLELTLRLAESTYDSIMAQLWRLTYVRRTSFFYDYHVYDDVELEIRLGSRTFRASEAYIYQHRDRSDVELVYVAVETLNDLARYTIEHAAPWSGLVFDEVIEHLP